MKQHTLLPLLALALGLASCGGGSNDSSAFAPRTLSLVAGTYDSVHLRGVDSVTGEPAARTLGTLTSVFAMPDGFAVVLSRSNLLRTVLSKVRLDGLVTRTSPAPWKAPVPGCEPALGFFGCFPINLNIAADRSRQGATSWAGFSRRASLAARVPCSSGASARTYR